MLVVERLVRLEDVWDIVLLLRRLCGLLLRRRNPLCVVPATADLQDIFKRGAMVLQLRCTARVYGLEIVRSVGC